MIAVASGKGGVGKSTVAANLALAFAALGKKAGLLDADIYGASQPTMMGLREKPESNADDMIVPPVRHGLKFMSMGFFVEPDAPVIWRGPMVHSAIQQLLRDVAWGKLDVLVIDLPPGTGDAQLSLAQYVPLSGAVIVSTPQDVALNEAKKGLRMFEKTGVPVLGMVENMSYHICSSCGHREHIFGHGGVKKASDALGVEFLGEIPLQTIIREKADAGLPIVAADPANVAAEAFKNIAARLWMRLPDMKSQQKIKA
jgi:ATP-binding protein involved in chromosome partitioning